MRSEVRNAYVVNANVLTGASCVSGGSETGVKAEGKGAFIKRLNCSTLLLMLFYERE